MKLSYEQLAVELEKIFQKTMSIMMDEKRELTDQEIADYCLRSETMIEACGWTVEEYTLRLTSDVDSGWDNNPHPTTNKFVD